MSVAGINLSPLNETLRRVEKWETAEVEQLLREIAGVLVHGFDALLNSPMCEIYRLMT